MSIDNKNNVVKVVTYSAPKPVINKLAMDAVKSSSTVMQRDLGFLYSPEFSKAIADRCKALMALNNKENFVSKKMSFLDFSKKVDGISKLNAYIESDPVLKNYGYNYDDILSDFKYACQHNIPVDFSFETRLPALENLRKFAADKNNKAIMDKLGYNFLGNIVVFNDDLVSTYSDESINNVQNLLSKKVLAPLRKGLDENVLLLLLKPHEQTKSVGRNLKIIEDCLKTNEYEFLKQNKSFNVSMLMFDGDMKKFMEALKKENASLKDGEYLRFFYNSSSNEVLLRKVKHFGKGLFVTSSKRFDKNFNLLAKENVIQGIASNGKKTMNVAVNDFSRKSDCNLRFVYDKNNKSWIMTDCTEKFKDEIGKVKELKVWKLSDVGGVYNIKTIDSFGKIKTVSSALKQNDGVHIEQNLTSPAGDKTFYKYFKSKSGKIEEFVYEIKDKNGKLLAKKESLFKRLSPNVSVSIVNGNKSRIEYFENEIRVIDEKTKKITSIDLKKLLPNGDKKIVRLLKKLTAPELLAVNQNVKVLDSIKATESFFMPGADEISSSLHRFVFEHELGHSKDSLIESLSDLVNDSKKSVMDANTKIVADEKLKKIFLSERKRFLEAKTTRLSKLASYFVTDNVERSLKKGMSEAIAEINAIVNAPAPPKWIMARTQLLKEDFPKTIAYLLRKYRF